MTGLETPISMAVDLYTNEDAQYLYVLDPQNSRIVVLDKKGQFKAEYLSEKIKEAKKIVVSEEEGKAIFITGPRLYSIELEHL